MNGSTPHPPASGSVAQPPPINNTKQPLSNGTTTKPAAAEVKANDHVGIVIPPPDIKVLVLKTADFIRTKMSGNRVYEREIRQRQRSNRKFDFLEEQHVYHRYYLYRLEQGNDAPEPQTDVAPPPPPAAAAAAAVTVPAPADKAAAITADAKPATTVQPPKKVTLQDKLRQKLASYKLSEVVKAVNADAAAATDAPTLQQKLTGDLDYQVEPNYSTTVTVKNITSELFDTIQLTARYTSVAGREFLQQLLHKQRNNVQYEFLQSAHPLFPYFKKLVDVYSKLGTDREKRTNDIKAELKLPPTTLLQTFILRARQHALDEAKRLEEEEKRQREQQDLQHSVAQIDWHTFVLAETIDFDSAEDDRLLPQPRTTIEEINMLFESVDVTGDSQQQQDTPMADNKPASKSDEPILLKDEQLIKQYMQNNSGAQQVQHLQLCPICSRKIPTNELEEHMRIELLDNRYRTQRAAMQEKLKTSALVGADDINANLNRLAGQRSDVFYSQQEREAAAAAQRAQQQQQQQYQQPPQTAPRGHMQPPTPHHHIPPPSQPQHLPGMPSAFQAAPHQPSHAQYHSPVPSPQQQQQHAQRPAAAQHPQLPAAHSHPPPTQAEQSPAKKPRLEVVSGSAAAVTADQLKPEGEWLARHPLKCTIRIQVATAENDTQRANFNFNGQTLSTDIKLTDTIAVLKQQLSKELNTMPPNKIKLSVGKIVMKDTLTCAYYNLQGSSLLHLAQKSRGGK